MKLFHDYTMRWWQVGLLKAYVFIIGILVGAYATPYVIPYTTPLLILAVILAGYFIYALVTDVFIQ